MATPDPPSCSTSHTPTDDACPTRCGVGSPMIWPVREPSAGT